VVPARTGFGKAITVEFYAPIDFANIHAEIKYDYRSFGEDIDLIMSNDYKFCLKQCTKICYYIQKLRGFEILKMNCEFVKDDKGTIWFKFA
jgi:hypothetical protein